MERLLGLIRFALFTVAGEDGDVWEECVPMVFQVSSKTFREVGFMDWGARLSPHSRHRKKNGGVAFSYLQK